MCPCPSQERATPGLLRPAHKARPWGIRARIIRPDRPFTHPRQETRIRVFLRNLFTIAKNQGRGQPFFLITASFPKLLSEKCRVPLPYRVLYRMGGKPRPRCVVAPSNLKVPSSYGFMSSPPSLRSCFCGQNGVQFPLCPNMETLFRQFHRNDCLDFSEYTPSSRHFTVRCTFRSSLYWKPFCWIGKSPVKLPEQYRPAN